MGTPASRLGRRPSTAAGQYDRRTLILSGALLAAILIGGIAFVALTTTEDGPRQDTQGQLTEQGGVKPHIIPRPNEGESPTDAGDRGGWEQLTLFGLLVASITGIGFVIFRGGRSARANRQAWLSLGESGVDGVIGDRVGPAHPTSKPATDVTDTHQPAS